MSDADWAKHKIGDLIDAGVLMVNDGYRVRREELGDHGIPFVLGGDIGSDGSISTQVTDHVRPEFHGRIRPKRSLPGDVAFICKGTVGRVGVLRDDQPEVVFAPQVAYWRVLDPSSLCPKFVYYLLTGREFQSNLHAVMTHGSMVADYVSIRNQRDFRLTYGTHAKWAASAQLN